jgi:catechol 2,3-dioxygenase-like lactoylglutathione lyase family enzyme
MLTNTALIAFLATTDSARSRAFYETVLGLTFVADEPFALIFDCHGTMLRIQKVAALTPAPFTALGWHVDDMAATVSGLVAQGVVFEKFPGMPQDERGVMAFPGGAQVAWFKDPDGNLLSLTQG